MAERIHGEKPMSHEDRYQLARLVDEFSREMRHRLYVKDEDGFTGWDDESNQEYLLERFEETMMRAIHEDPNRWVDVANFAAMLWAFAAGFHNE